MTDWLKLALELMAADGPRADSAESADNAEYAGQSALSALSAKGPDADWRERHAERSAIVQRDGCVPARYAAAFATLQMGCPANVPVKRWHQFIHDAGMFLDQWGATADALGWTADELFGLHPVAPLARYDSMGLLWLLQGEAVRMIDKEKARCSRGNAYYRRQLPSALPESGEMMNTAKR